MNTIRSTWVGWGSLCIAGGGAYYFAKKSINADRAHRHEEAQRRKEEALRRENSVKSPSSSPSAGRANFSPQADDTGNPSREAGHDPAATRHEPETLAEKIDEKGKYEAAEAYTSRKGNRL
ncbi:hypothetical protein I7I53_00350 [Histoplasma capsulatum var. duboisii H88]|uniref:Uncharacterized protein n=1 Tax=Ajellomyces capsulatus (strain H88) TaxID=544711 RepID=A0A8A1LGZ1_AJEC8|nr:hypothetical protein I7I53_00350 [Histoplasma capsulatum var. duboisii H88]